MCFLTRSFLYLLSILWILLLNCSTSYAHIVSASKVKQVSWKPRAFVYEGFLTDEECDHLISIAKPELKRSAVVDNVSGESKLSEVRTSSGMFIKKGLDSIVAGIEDKIASWTFLPKENGEDIQVLKYEHGEKYNPHYDYFTDKVNIAWGGHRIATVLMYLSDVLKGGETVFSSAEVPPHPVNALSIDGNELSECARKGVAVIPKKGDALLFFSLLPDATPDPLSLHAGCPVLEGEKWSATKWIHVDSFDKMVGGNCHDDDKNCASWAALGECYKNKGFMVGTDDLPGNCRRSCRVC